MKTNRTLQVESSGRSDGLPPLQSGCVADQSMFDDLSRRSQTKADRCSRLQAFTLIEIMVVVVLLSLIILGLLAMFDQTERAFKTGTAQTDQLEAGRMFSDLLVRDMEQIEPTGQSNAVNFWVKIPNYGTLQPLQQFLPPGSVRTDLLQDLYFVSRVNQTMSGIGYFVRTNPGIGGFPDFVGTLYRYQTNFPIHDFNANPQAAFLSLFTATNDIIKNPTSPGPVSKILDGVVEFRVHCYDTNGYLLNWESGINQISNNFVNFQDWQIPGGGSTSNDVQLAIFSNSIVPAYVEVQFGILEPAVLKRYNSIPNVIARQNFLSNHAGNVQLFRQRIPIRNVDPSAY